MIKWSNDTLRKKEWNLARTHLMDQGGNLKPNGTLFESPLALCERKFLLLDGEILAFDEKSISLVTPTEALSCIVAENEKKEVYFLTKNEKKDIDILTQTSPPYRYTRLNAIDGHSIQTLDQYLQKSKHISVDERYKLAVELCLLIDILHREGLTHSEIEPRNIYIDKNGKPFLSDLECRQLKRPSMEVEGGFRSEDNEYYIEKAWDIFSLSRLLCNPEGDDRVPDDSVVLSNGMLKTPSLKQCLHIYADAPEKISALNLASVLACARHGISLKKDFSREQIADLDCLAAQVIIKQEYIKPATLAIIAALNKNNIAIREELLTQDNLKIIQKLFLVKDIKLNKEIFSLGGFEALKQLEYLKRRANIDRQVRSAQQGVCGSGSFAYLDTQEGYFNQENIKKISEDPKKIIEIAQVEISNSPNKRKLRNTIDLLLAFDDDFQVFGCALKEASENYFISELIGDKKGLAKAQKEFMDTFIKLHAYVKTYHHATWTKKAMVLLGNVLLLASVVGIFVKKAYSNVFFFSAQTPAEKLTKEIEGLSNHLRIRAQGTSAH